MAVENINDAYETAQGILDTLNEIYMAHADEAAALPTRQYIAIGGAASQPHDCEQVTVSMEQIYSGMPGQPSESPVRCNVPRSGVFYVEVVRQTIPIQQASRRGSATPVSLSPEQENQIARVQMQDAVLMLEAGLRVGEDFLGGMADVSAGPESGGYQAMVMTVITGIA